MNVIQDTIYGEAGEGLNLYMVVWQRIANSGFVYGYAKDEIKAKELYGFSDKFCHHTVVKISEQDMPVESGIKN